MPNKVQKYSFNAGEISNYLAGRQDLTKYYNGCSILCNGTVLPYGGVVKRSGTEFIGVAKTQCILKSFEFSVADSLILEFGEEYVRFYKDGARIYETALDNPDVDSGSDDVTYAHHGYIDGDWVKFSGTRIVPGVCPQKFLCER